MSFLKRFLSPLEAQHVQGVIINQTINKICPLIIKLSQFWTCSFKCKSAVSQARVRANGIATSKIKESMFMILTRIKSFHAYVVNFSTALGLFDYPGISRVMIKVSISYIHVCTTIMIL